MDRVDDGRDATNAAVIAGGGECSGLPSSSPASSDGDTVDLLRILPSIGVLA